MLNTNYLNKFNNKQEKISKLINSIIKCYQNSNNNEYKIYGSILLFFLIIDHFYKKIILDYIYLKYILFVIFFINIVLFQFIFKNIYLIVMKKNYIIDTSKKNYYLILYSKLFLIYPFFIAFLINFFLNNQIMLIINQKNYLNVINIIIFIINILNYIMSLIIMIIKINFVFEIIPRKNSLANNNNLIDFILFIQNYIIIHKNFLNLLILNKQIIQIFLVFLFLIYIKIWLKKKLVYDIEINKYFYQIFIIYSTIIIVDYLSLLIFNFKINNFIIILIPLIYKVNQKIFIEKFYDFINDDNNWDENRFLNSLFYCYEIFNNPMINSKFYLIYNSILKKHLKKCNDCKCVCFNLKKKKFDKYTLKDFCLKSLQEKIRKGAVLESFYYISIELLIRNDFQMNSSLTVLSIYIKNKKFNTLKKRIKLYILKKRIEEWIKLNYQEKNINDTLNINFKENYKKGEREINKFYKPHLKIADLIKFKNSFDNLKLKILNHINIMNNIYKNIKNDKLNVKKLYNFLKNLKENSDDIEFFYDKLYLKTNKYVCSHIQLMVLFYNFVENKFISSIDLIKKINDRLNLANKKLFKSNEKISNYNIFTKSISVLIGAFKKELGIIKDVFGDILKYLNYDKKEIINRNIKEIIFGVIRENHDFLIGSFTNNMKDGFLGVQRKMVIINKLGEAQSIYFSVKLFPVFDNNLNYVSFVKFWDSINKYYILLTDKNEITAFSKTFNNIISKNFLVHNNLKDICNDLCEDLKDDEEFFRLMNDENFKENKKNYYKLIQKDFKNKIYSFQFKYNDKVEIFYFNAKIKYHYFIYNNFKFFYKYLSLKEKKDIETNLIKLNPFCEEINFNLEINNELKNEQINEKNKIYNINKNIIYENEKLLIEKNSSKDYNSSSLNISDENNDKNYDKKSRMNTKTHSSNNSINLINNKKLKFIEEIIKKSKLNKYLIYLLVFIILGIILISVLSISLNIIQDTLFKRLNNDYKFFNYLLKFYQETEIIYKFVLLNTSLNNNIIKNNRYSNYGLNDFFTFSKSQITKYDTELIASKKEIIQTINHVDNFNSQEFLFDNFIKNELFKNIINVSFNNSFYIILNNLANFSKYIETYNLNQYNFNINNTGVYTFLKQYVFQIEPFYQEIMMNIFTKLVSFFLYYYDLFIYLLIGIIIINVIILIFIIWLYFKILLDFKNLLYIYNKLKKKDIFFKTEELNGCKIFIKKFQNNEVNTVFFEKFKYLTNKIDYNQIKDTQNKNIIKKKVIKKNKYFSFNQKWLIILLILLFFIIFNLVLFMVYTLYLRKNTFNTHIYHTKLWFKNYLEITKLNNQINNGLFLKSIDKLNSNDKQFILNNIDNYLKEQIIEIDFKELIFTNDNSNNYEIYDIYNNTICSDSSYNSKFGDYCNILNNFHFRNTSFIFLYQNYIYEFNDLLLKFKNIIDNKEEVIKELNSEQFKLLEIVYFIINNFFYLIFENLFQGLNSINNKYSVFDNNILYILIAFLIFGTLILSVFINYRIRKLKLQLEYIFMTISSSSLINNNTIKWIFLNYFNIKNQRVLNN